MPKPLIVNVILERYIIDRDSENFNLNTTIDNVLN